MRLLEGAAMMPIIADGEKPKAKTVNGAGQTVDGQSA